MKKYFSLILILISVQGHALNTILDGSAMAFKGRVVRLSAYSDMISNRIELISTALIDNEGKFSMQMEVSDTSTYILSIGFRKASIFLVPGGHYSCQINVNPDSILQERLPEVVQELPILLDHLAGNDVNFQLSGFNKALENFLVRNASGLKPGNKKVILDSLIAFRQHYKYPPGSFTDIYSFYKLADIESMVNRWDDMTIYRHFIKDRPIRYGNPAYMDYFNVFFEHYLLSKSQKINFQDLDKFINKSMDLKALTDILGKDSILRNERLREAVLLKNLGELYYDVSFASQNVYELIKTIGQSSKYPEHRLIAGNLVFQLTQLSKGSTAPEFSFIDHARVERSLADSRGKWVYLSFFTTWCKSCISEMKVIPSLKLQYGNKVTFISVCCNENQLELGYFLQANKSFDWIFFNLEDSMDIVNDYRVMTYPYYVLIDPEGRIFQYPAKSPEDHLKDLFDLLFK